MVLVSVFPPSFTNDQLRRNYPTLLQQPGYLLREFLDNNNMARQIYGSSLLSDTYGMLRLKMMGCVVAIVQHAHEKNAPSFPRRSTAGQQLFTRGILIRPSKLS